LQAAARGDVNDKATETEQLRMQKELLQQRSDKLTLAELEHRSRVDKFKRDNHRLEQELVDLEEDKRQCRRDREHVQELREVIQHTTTKSAIMNPSTQWQDKTRCISDALIGPKPWTGLSSDDPESWMEIFTNYCNFRELKESDSLRLMIILQQGAAGLWVQTLPTSSKSSLPALVQAFKDNYFRSPELKFQDASELWSCPQKATEPFNDYLTRLRRGANRLNISDEVLHYAVLNGLKPAVKSHILQQGVKSLQDTIKSARVAEATLSSDPISALLLEAIRVTQDSSEKQAQQIKDLTTKVSTLSAVALAPLHQIESIQAPINLTGNAQTTSNQGSQQTNQSNQRQPQQRHENTANYQPRDYQPRFTRATPQNLQRANYGRNQAATRQNYNQQNQPPLVQANESICVNCRLTHPAGVCPANRRQCFACGAYNHFARACDSVRRN
jgi:Retrotransposon gag protein